jgi:phosphoenolpyruvate-protein kinase (PTS system EI component)
MPFFIGCGVNELSMTSQHVLPTRAAIHKLNYKKCQELVKTILASSTAAEIHEKFQKFKEM